jgi:hypothetical protein
MIENKNSQELLLLVPKDIFNTFDRLNIYNIPLPGGRAGIAWETWET